ncbi:MAG: hypothetical protein IT298_13515 [Chloroflexi bacterium]|nr:hypothetical protein [Chloroflexota bacterium]MEB2365217.1 hypothetical protein [Chloroflexota bacterium]
MRRLDAWLKERPELTPLVVQRWGLKLGKRSQNDPEAVAKQMLDPANATRIYDSLPQKGRDALKMLNGSGNQISEQMFVRMYDPIRKMGAGQIEREKPHEKPVGTTETLYYAGLIGFGIDKLSSGLGPIVYIPDDLAAVLPFSRTSYNLDPNAATLEDLEDEIDFDDEDEDEDAEQSTRVEAQASHAHAPAPVPAHESAPQPARASARIRKLETVENPRAADTSLVDDLTTLLAFLQVMAVRISGTFAMDEAARQVLRRQLIVNDPQRLTFLFLLGISSGMIYVEDGVAYTQRDVARPWLEASRAQQTQQLAQAWRASKDYVDLLHVPGLNVETEGWSYDPVTSRGEILNLIHSFVPIDAAWTVDEFISAVKEREPAYQRPGGDFDSWYIRGESGDYLSGFEDWDAVDGALLDFVITQPLHWLGLLTLGDNAAQLNAYGRAFLADQPFPSRAEPDDRPTLDSDGILRVGRAFSRFDRFQIARFTTWVSPATAVKPYEYRIDAAGIQRGAAQGISTDRIAKYMQRVMGLEQLPDTIGQLLHVWKAGAQANVWFEQVVVLRTTSIEVLDAIWKEPQFRRYLGARLGETAVTVRADQLEALEAALGAAGIDVQRS